MAGHSFVGAVLFLIVRQQVVHAVEYTPITEDTKEFADFVSFSGENDVNITLSQDKNERTKQIAVSLTTEAYDALTFDAWYNVSSKDCRSKTTAKFAFGEQIGVWDKNSTYFRVLMLKGKVDPVVPFTLDQPVNISYDAATKELTVISGNEHNWVPEARVNNASEQGTEIFLPRFYLLEESAPAECKAEMGVVLQLHNVKLWQETYETSTVSRTSTVAPPPSVPTDISSKSTATASPSVPTEVNSTSTMTASSSVPT